MYIGILALAVLAFGTAYRFYAGWIARHLDVDDTRAVPSHTHYDGVDYVPTRPLILFGHHFSSIAGAGPIVGPVIAAMAFGWMPALAWILLGAIFVGGVHDFTSLLASVRHGSRSIAEISRRHLSWAAYRAFLLFILLTMIYVIIVFLDLTSSTFAPIAKVGPDLPDAARLSVREGGAVATASVLYMLLAVLFGLAHYRAGVRVEPLTLVFVPLVFAAVLSGLRWPLTADLVPEVFGAQKHFWNVALLIYCWAASVLPVWLLLQPRDYLASFLLYGCLLGGVVGVLGASVRGMATVSWPGVRPLFNHDAGLGFVFPALFVTIACGAVSGFHSIVASGTTAKQLDRESSAQPVGYGSMLVEGVLAVLAVMTVMLLKDRTDATPVQVFAGGLGRLLNAVGLPPEAARVFGMMAVSTFLLTTLDTCTRLARFLFEELTQWRGTTPRRITASLVVLVIPAFMVFRELPGPNGVMMPAWKVIWPAFGASNQLLAALALVVVFAWLRSQRRRAAFVAIPMSFMVVTTTTALLQLSWRHLIGGGSRFVGTLSLTILVLALWVIVEMLWRTWRAHPEPEPR